MKKILTISIIALSVWVISTFIIGNQTEEHLKSYIAKSNKLYQNNGISLKLLDYNKSFLTSIAQVEVNVKDPKVLKNLQSTYKLPFVLDYSIEHGPLFFKNGFGIGLSKIEHTVNLSSLLQDETKQNFLTSIGKDILIESNILISFLKEAHYNIWSEEIKFNKNGKAFHMTALKIVGTSNLETLKGSGEIKVEDITLTEENSSNGIEIKNLLLNLSIDEVVDSSFVFGDFGLAVDNFIVKDDSSLKYKKIDVAFKGKINNVRNDKTTMNSLFEGDIDFKNTLLPNEFKTLKTLYLKMNLKDLGIKGMLDFQKSAQNMQEKQTKLLTELQSGKSENMALLFTQLSKLQEEMSQQLIHALNDLLIKNKTNAMCQIEVETKDNKRSQSMIQVGYTGDIKFIGTTSEIRQEIQKKILELISLNMDIELNKAHLKIIPNNQQLQQQIQMGVLQGFVKENNESFSLNGSYKNRELIINDNNLTSIILPFLMMATHF